MIIDYRNSIILALSLEGPRKARDLSLDIMSNFNPSDFNRADFDTALNELIEDGNIIPLYYSTEDSPTQIILFLKGTKFSFNGTKI